MNNKMTCDPERIELFLGQKLSDEEQTAFELHLDDCNDCRHRLEAAAAGDDVWSGVRDALWGEQLPPDSPRPGDPALDSATGGDASFSHDTVLKLLAPTDDDRMIPYLVMPYVRGPSLQRRLDREGPLALVEILRIGMQAATMPDRAPCT